MLIDKTSLALLALATSDEPQYRWATHCVHVDPDGTAVATTGRAIIAVESAGMEDDDYPCVGKPAKIPAKGINVPADVAKEVLRNIPRLPINPVLGAALVTKTSKERVELTTTDLNRTRRLSFTPDDKGFPDWRVMIDDPTEDEVGCVTLALDQLDIIVKTLKAICKEYQGKTPFVTFHMCGADKYTILEGDVGGGRRFIGALAPVNRKTHEWSDWQTSVMSKKRVRRIARKVK